MTSTVVTCLLCFVRTARAQPLTFVASILYSPTASWTALPGTRVVAELLAADGTVVGRDDALADVRGDVTIAFAPTDPGGPASLVESGRRIVLSAGQPIHPVVTATVPALLVAPTRDRHRLVGVAPPGAALTVSLGAGRTGQVALGRTVADGAGHFDMAMDAPLPADALGDVVYVDAEGNAFRAPFAVFLAEHAIGAREVVGRASAGSRVAVTLTAASGARVGGFEGRVDASRRWVAQRDSGPLLPGDRIVVSIHGPIPDASAVVHGKVPVLSLVLSDDRMTLLGEATPGATVALSWEGAQRRAEGGEAVADQDGAFALALAAPLPAGASARAVVVDGGVAFSTELVETVGLEIELFGQLLRGTIDEPGAAVSIRLHAADGSLKDEGTSVSSAAAQRDRPEGYFSYRLSPSVRIEPHDVLELDWRAGDPWRVAVPALTAVADGQRDAVLGDGPPGARLEVHVRRGPPVLSPVAAVRVGDDGRYRADLGGLVDLGADGADPILGGAVVLGLAGGVRVVHSWVASHLSLDEAGTLSGFGPPARDVSVALVGPDGVVRGTYDERLEAGSAGSRGRWSAALRDGAGFPAIPRPDDRLDVQVGDEVISLIVPELRGVLHMAERRLAGRTTPGAAVWLSLPGELGEDRAAIADAAGYFDHRFDEAAPLTADDAVRMTLRVAERHAIVAVARGPAIALNLDGGLLDGSHEPRTAIRAAVVRGPTVLSAASTATDERGAYRVELPGLDDPARALRAGDALNVEAPAAEGNRLVDLVIPELSIDLDRALRVVRGRAVPGGGLRLSAEARYPRALFAEGQSWSTGATIAPDGTYQAVLPPVAERGPDLRPGQVFGAAYSLPSGHRVERVRIVPIASIHLGGAEVCGVGAPWTQASAELLGADGTRLGRGSTRAGGDGNYSLILRDDLGRPVRSAAGQRVSATLGVEVVVVDLPDAAVSVRWDTPRAGSNDRVSTLTGHGPGGWDAYVTAPSTACLAPARPGGPLPQEAMTTEDGAIRPMTLPASLGHFGLERRPVPAGGAVELAFFTSHGHRYYLRADRGKIVAYAGTARVQGHAVPVSPIRLVLEDAGGLPRASAEALADPEGAFEARLLDDARRPVAMAPGDRLVLATETGDEALAIEPLDLDVSVASGLFGQAPPGRAVLVVLRLGDGRHVTATRIADSEGRFTYGVSDRPPRADWTFADVVSARAVLRSEPGHELVADTQEQTTDPTPHDGRRAYLPRAVR